MRHKVSRVTDGDTIKVRNAKVEKIIRLVGIDAPEISRKKREPSQPFGQAATKYLAELVLNKTVEIKEYGQDRYGRTLGVVSQGGKNVNMEMVKAGYAEFYRGTPAPGFDSAPYWKAEEEARAAKKGMWAQGDKYVSPREWRRVNRGRETPGWKTTDRSFSQGCSSQFFSLSSIEKSCLKFPYQATRAISGAMV